MEQKKFEYNEVNYDGKSDTQYCCSPEYMGSNQTMMNQVCIEV